MVGITGLFENDVKMYGIQTMSTVGLAVMLFENDVKMYGIQTKESREIHSLQFENDVKT